MKSPLPTKLIDPTLLFDFEIPFKRLRSKPTESRKDLGDAYLLPHLASMTGLPTFAKVAAAWSNTGLYFDIDFELTEEMLNRLPSNLMFNAHLWIDTRYDPANRRANQSSHQFWFGTPLDGNPVPPRKMVYIQRALSVPTRVEPASLAYSFERHSSGCRMRMGIPESCLSKYAPTEVKHLGFFYEVTVSEQLHQSLALSREFRYFEDPGLWSRASLEDAQ